ncbi:MAG: hypothetical protein MZU97_08565 [Bacillus subtilis]|nr:hypothetical protein [Bacillus subtilis]
MKKAFRIKKKLEIEAILDRKQSVGDANFSLFRRGSRRRAAFPLRRQRPQESSGRCRAQPRQASGPRNRPGESVSAPRSNSS